MFIVNHFKEDAVDSYLNQSSVESFEQAKSYIESCKKNNSHSIEIDSLPKYLPTSEFYKKIYCSGDEKLIHMLWDNFFRPSKQLLDQWEGQVTQFLKNEHAQADKTVSSLVQQHGLGKLENNVVKIQRCMRFFLKRKREFHRLMFMSDTVLNPILIRDICAERGEVPELLEKDKFEEYFKIFSDVSKIQRFDKKYKDRARRLIKESNRPYEVKCSSKQLSKKIYDIAKTIPNIASISHVTSADALATIFDTSLFGRRSLVSHQIGFRKAALGFGDVMNGDGDAICFGSQLIDNCAYKENSVEFRLSLEKLLEKGSNPCMFYKQQDLGFHPHNRIRKVKVRDNFSIQFDHTWGVGNLSYHSYCRIADQNRMSTATVPNQLLISSNIKDMSTILTLNFFRYVDALTDQELKEKIYNELEKLNDEELKDFLIRLRDASTDTMEFNFYGAYTIDLDCLESIKFLPNGDSNEGVKEIELQELVKTLNEGDLDSFHYVKGNMPFLFKSKRFVDYLTSCISDSEKKESFLRELEK